MNARNLVQAVGSLFFREMLTMSVRIIFKVILPLRGARGVLASPRDLDKIAVRKNTPRTPIQGGIARVMLLCSLFVLHACSTYNPTGTGDTTILSAPTNVTFRFVSGAVEVSWQFTGDATKLQQFRIYRRAVTEAAFKRIAVVTLATRTYRDSTVTIGSPYQYQVAAVNKANVEGMASDAATVTPLVFGAQIANGAKFTNRRLITLTFNAPNNTALMMIANNSAFTGAIWEAFQNTKTWELSEGDGVKTVYIKFRTTDQADSDVVQATITLDTSALINAIEHDGAGRMLRVGDVLHLRLETTPPDTLGNATVDLIDNVNGSNMQDTNIRLFDNGRNGDLRRGDGVYELDYRIRPDLEFAQAFAYGNFTDAAANLAQQRVSPTSFAVQLPPKAVTLFNPVPDSASTALMLTWATSNERDFANYQIYRSETLPVDSTGKSTPLKIINDNGTTTHRDATVTPNTNYFYRVFVYDRSGLFAGSNEVQGLLKK